MLPLGSHPCACDLLPHLESLPHFLTVLGSGKPMPSRAEVVGNETIRREEPLRMPRGFNPPLSAALAGAWAGGNSPRGCSGTGVGGAPLQAVSLASRHHSCSA